MKKYIAYYRVSTQKQGNSGLGLDAQRTTVINYVGCTDCIISEYTETESGKNDNRTELNKAIHHAKQTGAVLIIAKLDRLSRNVAFLFQLRDAGVNFECCDLPDLNTMTLGIFATFAQFERERISQRTKDALQSKKAQGYKLGTPANLDSKAIAKGLEARKANAANNKENKQAKELVMMYTGKGLNLVQIAEKLNSNGYTTRRGKSFTATQVHRFLKSV